MSDDARPPSLMAYAGALVLLCLVVFCITWWFSTPPATMPVPALPPSPPHVAKKTGSPSASPLPPTISTTHVQDRNAIDPDIQRLADDLASRSQTPVRDLEIVNEFIGLYSKAFQGNPIGLNEDITAVLTGHNYRKGILFPPNNPMIVKGQIVDRWGTPYWFHSNSSTHMEIRSAGPDKSLFTPDDVVINPGPDNMGIGVVSAR